MGPDDHEHTDQHRRYDDAEGLPEELENLSGQIPLKQCKIELIRSSDHKVVDSITIDRFSYAEEANNE